MVDLRPDFLSRGRSTVLSDPTKSKSGASRTGPQIGSANDSKVRQCPTLCHEVGHSFVGTMVPTKSKSVTGPKIGSANGSQVRQCPTLCHEVGHQFCRHHGADKIEVGHRSEDRIYQRVKGQTVSDFVSRGRSSVLSAPWCRQNQSLTLTDHCPSDRIYLRVKGRTVSDFVSRGRSTVLSAPWCRQNQSLTLTDDGPSDRICQWVKDQTPGRSPFCRHHGADKIKVGH
jgi:hypothetical protein